MTGYDTSAGWHKKTRVGTRVGTRGAGGTRERPKNGHPLVSLGNSMVTYVTKSLFFWAPKT